MNDTVSEAERSIIVKYRKQLWKPFIKAVKKYNLVEEGDKIAVCISGGKDSMLMAKLMQELMRHGDRKFEAVFLTMDPGYNAVNRNRIEINAKMLGVPIHFFETDVFTVANSAEKSPCYLCARMRRGYLYSKAKELGCNKIALGHHKNDVVETTLMGMLYGSQLQGMMPKLNSKNFEGMQLIRPMYMVEEQDIIRWRDYNNLEFIACACRFTEGNVCCGSVGSARYKVKGIIKALKKDNPKVEDHILKSLENVQLDTFISYKSQGVKYNNIGSEGEDF